MAIDFARLSDPAYRNQLQNDEGRDGQQFRRMIREGQLNFSAPAPTPSPSPSNPAPAPAPAVTLDTSGGGNRDTQEMQRQQRFNAERDRIRQIAMAAGMNPDDYARVATFYDPVTISMGGDDDLNRWTAPVEDINGGDLTLRPDGTVSMQELVQKAYKGSGAEWQGVSFDQWLNGPYSPWRVNSDGSGAYYDPSKFTVHLEYNPKDTGLDALIPNLIKGVALGGIGAGLAGLAGIGPLAGTTAAADAAAAGSVFPFDPSAAFGAADALGAATGAAGGGALGDSFSLSSSLPEMVAGDSAFAPSALDSFLNTTPIDLAASGGSAALPAAGANFGPLSSIADMISGLSGGGSLISSGLGGLGSALGSIAGGGVSGLGALTDILQTVGDGTGALEFGASTPGILETIGKALGIGKDAAGAGSALSKLLGGNSSGTDLLGLLGKLGATGLGIYGANKQQDAFADLAQKYLDLGAPARARLEASYADPGSFLTGPDVQAITQQGADAAARALSTQFGNPALSPTAWSELMDYNTKSQFGQLQNYRRQLAAEGGLGVAPGASFDANAASGTLAPFNVGSALLGDLTNPKTSALDQMAQLAKAFGGGNSFGNFLLS